VESRKRRDHDRMLGVEGAVIGTLREGHERVDALE